MTTIAPITLADHDDWLRLWAGYLVFYEEALPRAVTDDVFARITADDGVHGAIARDVGGEAVGLVHWLLHPSTWSTRPYCYLEDLFVDPGARGAGIGGSLIAHVRQQAAVAGAAKVYWSTQQTNTTARALYDRVARTTGFVQYETGVGPAS